MAARSTAVLLVAAAALAGCSPSGDPPVAASPTVDPPVSTAGVPLPEPPATSPVTTSSATSPVTTSPVTTSVTPSSSASTAGSPSPDSTMPSTPAAATTTPAGSPSTSTGSQTVPVVDPAAGEDVEPSFDLGPSVSIDVDVARFPVDDAGLGGGGTTRPTSVPPSPGSDDTGGGPDADPEAAPPGSEADLTGWAAFNASLESSLLRAGNTAGAVAVMIGGDLVNAAAFGVRDPTRPDPAQPTDRFRIASISKPITAIVALELVERGLVGLDEPVGRRIAEHVGATAVSAGADGLTLRRLLTHTSGFGKYYTTFFQRGAEDCADAARQGLARAGGGGGYEYSNMNYCLAGLLVEAVTGDTLERATYELLLTPLGLSGMRLAPTVDPGPGETQHLTTAGRAYMETLGGAGAWIASPVDLVTILDSLDTSTPGFKPLDPLTVFQMATPAGGRLGQRGYGMGLISYGDGRLGHTGTIESTRAMVLDRGDGVIWAVTVAGSWPAETEQLERLVDEAFVAGGFVAG